MVSDRPATSNAAAVALAPGQLRAQLPEAAFPASTDDITPLEAVAGQQRAQEAIAFGLSMRGDGFNIAVSGPAGSGRMTLVRLLLEEAATSLPPADDWCYLHNFADPYRPVARALTPGTGDDLQRQLASLVELCRTEIPRAFDSESYGERIQQALAPNQQARADIMGKIEREATTLGFAVNLTPMGFITIPLGRSGQPITPDVLAGLPPDVRAGIESRGEILQQHLLSATADFRRLDKEAREAIEQVDREVTRFVVGGLLDELRQAYSPYALDTHFDAIEQDILANLEQYKRFAGSALAQMPPHVVAEFSEAREALLRRYAANLLVTHGDHAPAHAPIVFEQHATYYNLFGRIDRVPHYGALTTDFTQIRPGSVHAANGGYLVLQLEDLLREPITWEKLKRSLKTREVRVDDIGEGYVPFPTSTLRPEPIPLSLKVVLIGPPGAFALLDVLDSDFRELFKARAEFEPDTPCDEVAVAAYCAYVRRIAGEHQLPPFTADALREVVHYGNRLTGRNDRLSARYGLIADTCRESGQVAIQAGASLCAAEHVLAAIEGKRRRSSLVPDRLRRMIAEGTLHVETTGAVEGQANGLAVFQAGSHAFGIPMRITCRLGMGRRGVVAIEREVERSGAIHTKGVLVLTGYLLGTFGREQTLAFTASLTFEQSYDEVEGDSASSAELYAILTSLARVPIRQDVAVTGSVDQFGRIQPVGGVTEKVEGFFDVCTDVGLTGTQGVMIPHTNVVNLTLRPEIVEAVREGRFHIWAVATVEEGLELLTGVPAGALQEDGTYPEGSIFRQVADELTLMARRAAPAPGETR